MGRKTQTSLPEQIMLPFLLCGHFSMHGCEETERSKAGYSEKFIISQGFTNDIRCSLT